MDTLRIIGELLQTTLVFSTALIFTALGGIFSERSGVVNIGLEGLMVCGAFASAVSVYYAEQAGMIGAAPWIGLLAAALFAMLVSAIHAVASITFKANQVVSGVVINFFVGRHDDLLGQSAVRRGRADGNVKCRLPQSRHSGAGVHSGDRPRAVQCLPDHLHCADSRDCHLVHAV